MLRVRATWNPPGRKTLGRLAIVAQAAVASGLLLCTPEAYSDSITATNAARIVQQYRGAWTSPPVITDTSQSMDAPLLGNGDVGVAILGPPSAMTFILSKNEFWSLNNGDVKAMARMNMAIAGLSGSTYRMEQDISKGEIDGTFGLSGNSLQTTSWVQATDTTNNLLVTKFIYSGSARQAVSISFAPGNGNSFPTSNGSSADVLYFDVSADDVAQVGGFNTRSVRLATRVVGATGTVSGGTLTFTLSPGGTYYLLTSIISNYDSSTHQTTAISNVSSKVASDIESLKTAHESWWSSFYAASFVEIADKTLEKEWYGSLYLLASSSRAGEAAPGLWGDWIADNPAFNGDYTLNYNYEVPFMMSLPTNHLDLAKSYDKPVLDWIPHAQAEATANGWTGAYYRVHIGPLPNGSADTNEWNQKSLGAYAATNMIMRYYYTRDTTYANSGIYNYLKQVALFWQNYLVWDGTRYVITNDAQQEGDSGPQTNGIMSLGLVRFLLQGCIDMSTDLGVDPALRSSWQNILSHLSAFPTQTRNGQTVFRWTEVGRDWNGDNSVGIQHIYPGSQIGLDSDPTTLQIARNMVGQMARWNDQNGTNTFYPAAARIGYDPNTILTQLDSWVAGNTYPNMFIHTGGGGIEGFNTVPATLAEMFIQSFQGKIRVFANWPAGTDAKFGDLVAYGNFLVSSDIRGNVVQYVRFVSQRGGSLVFHNPWPGQTLVLYRNGTASATLTGTDIPISTSAGEALHVAPNGTSYSSILSLMNVPGPTDPTITASSDYPTDGRFPTDARDDILDSFWSSHFWTSPTDFQWLAVDLGAATSVNRWVVRHYGGSEDARDFKLQKSADGSTWTDVDSVTGNTADVTDRRVPMFSSRFLRVFITAPQQGGVTQWARIREFELYNQSLAFGAKATADASCAPGEQPQNAVDGSLSTKWCSNADLGAQWLRLDLGTNITISRWVVEHAGAGGEGSDWDTKNFKLQKSTDGNAWTDVDTVTNNTADVTDRTVAPFTSRYVRLFITVPTQTTDTAARIYEFQLY
jgi:alpha-L-fucosidase 2